MVRQLTHICLCLILGLSALAASTPQEAESAIQEGLEFMRQADNAPAGSGHIVEAAVKMLEARTIYEDLADQDKVREVNSYLFWCRKKMTNSEIDQYLAATGTKGSSKEKAARDAKAAIAQLETKQVSKDEATDYYAAAERFAAKNKSKPYRVHIRFLEVADRFADKDPAVAIKAQKKARDAFDEYKKQEQERLAAQQAAIDKDRESIGEAKEMLKRLKIDDIFTKQVTASGNTPAPDRRELSSASREMKKLYKEQLKMDDDRTLAKYLFKQARSSKGDPALCYVLATEAIEHASDRKVSDVRLVHKIVGFLAKHFADIDVAELKKEAFDDMHRQIGAAAATMLDNPEDPEANTWVGMATAFVSDDLKAALPMLARSDREAIVKVAKMEAANPKKADEQLQLAQAWLEIADESDWRDMEISIKRRGLSWLERCVGSIGGANKRRVEEQIAELHEEVPLRPEDVDLSKLNDRQFARLAGMPATIPALKGPHPVVTLAAGQRVQIVPDPSGEWQIGYDYGSLKNCGADGYQAYIYDLDNDTGIKLGTLAVYVQSNPNAKPKIMKAGVVEGPCAIGLGMFKGKRGSDCYSRYYSNAKGKMRVKIVPLPEAEE